MTTFCTKDSTMGFYEKKNNNTNILYWLTTDIKSVFFFFILKETLKTDFLEEKLTSSKMYTEVLKFNVILNKNIRRCCVLWLWDWEENILTVFFLFEVVNLNNFSWLKFYLCMDKCFGKITIYGVFNDFSSWVESIYSFEIIWVKGFKIYDKINQSESTFHLCNIWYKTRAFHSLLLRPIYILSV